MQKQVTCKLAKLSKKNIRDASGDSGSACNIGWLVTDDKLCSGPLSCAVLFVYCVELAWVLCFHDSASSSELLLFVLLQQLEPPVGGWWPRCLLVAFWLAAWVRDYNKNKKKIFVVSSSSMNSMRRKKQDIALVLPEMLIPANLKKLVTSGDVSPNMVGLLFSFLVCGFLSALLLAWLCFVASSGLVC